MTVSWRDQRFLFLRRKYTPAHAVNIDSAIKNHPIRVLNWPNGGATQAMLSRQDSFCVSIWNPIQSDDTGRNTPTAGIISLAENILIRSINSDKNRKRVIMWKNIHITYNTIKIACQISISDRLYTGFNSFYERCIGIADVCVDQKSNINRWELIYIFPDGWGDFIVEFIHCEFCKPVIGGGIKRLKLRRREAVLVFFNNLFKCVECWATS